MKLYTTSVLIKPLDFFLHFITTALVGLTERCTRCMSEPHNAIFGRIYVTWSFIGCNRDSDRRMSSVSRNVRFERSIAWFHVRDETLKLLKETLQPVRRRCATAFAMSLHGITKHLNPVLFSKKVAFANTSFAWHFKAGRKVGLSCRADEKKWRASSVKH